MGTVSSAEASLAHCAVALHGFAATAIGLAAVKTALFSITGRETGLPYTDALRIRSIPSSVVGPVISPPWLRHLVYRWLRVLQIADA